MSDNAISIIRKARAVRVLCVGDVMLDRYVYGAVSRISPEAPIPVLAHRHETRMLGAAGNVARNLAALGADTVLLGVVGDDAAGGVIAQLAAEDNAIDAQLVVSSARPTTVKTRFVAAGQQVLRVDEEVSGPLDDIDMRRLCEAIAALSGRIDVVLVSDYAKGVVSPDVIAAIHAFAAERGIAIIVDPKGDDFARYGAVDLIKPNAGELSRAAGMPTDTDAEIEAALAAASAALPARSIVVTRADKGLSFITGDGNVVHRRGRKVEVYDVSGAGDTSLAALALAIAAGASLMQAADLALLASGIAVTKRGTAAVTAAEIEAAASPPGAKPVATDLESVAGRVASWRAEGLSVGFTNGCFDILHPGHLKVLEEARARCDRLVVGLNSDASVRRLKGEARPVNNADDRARLLLGFAVVDAVVVFDEETPAMLIERLKPDLLVKGGDYAPATIVGYAETIARGGAVHIVALEDGKSTTAIIARAAQS